MGPESGLRGGLQGVRYELFPQRLLPKAKIRNNSIATPSESKKSSFIKFLLAKASESTAFLSEPLHKIRVSPGRAGSKIGFRVSPWVSLKRDF